MPEGEKEISTSNEKTQQEAVPAVEIPTQSESALSPEEVQKRSKEFEQTKREGEERDRAKLSEIMAELGEHFRKEQAREFVTKELPETEERIEQKMDPECQVCVVIPAYGERDYILRPLGSLAEQQDVDPRQFEVIFVINNQSDVRDVKENDKNYKRRIEKQKQRAEENQETLRLFEAIMSGSNERIRPEEQEIVDLIRKSGIRFYAIDKASHGKGFPADEANVGGARHRGVCEAVERFLEIDRNGIVAQTDADTRLSPGYIRSLIDVFEKNPDVVGVCGDSHSDTIEGKSLPPESAVLRKTKWMYGIVARGIIEKIQTVQTGEKPKTQVEFAGANMASRAYEAALAGAVPKSAEGGMAIGGEDTQFGRNLAEIGKTIRAPEVLTYPLERESERTSTGQGRIIFEAKEKFGTVEKMGVDDLEKIAFENGIENNVVGLLRSGNISFDAMRQMFSFKGEQLLDNNQIEEMVSLLSGFRDIEEMKKNKQIRKIARIMEDNLSNVSPKIPVQEALSDLKRRFMENPDLAVQYETAVTRFEGKLDVEDKKAKFGEKIIDAVFEEGLTKELSPEKLREIIERNGSDSGFSAEEVSSLIQDTETLEMFCRAIAGSRDKSQALTNFKRFFSISLLPSVDAALRSNYISLSAMKDILEREK